MGNADFGGGAGQTGKTGGNTNSNMSSTASGMAGGNNAGRGSDDVEGGV